MTGYIGYEINPPETDQLCTAIGKAIVNFGMIELLSHEILRLINSEKYYNKLRKQPFKTRMNHIIGSIQSGKFDTEIKESCEALIKNTNNLSDFRAAIAHNPACFGKKTTESGEEISFAVIPIMTEGKDYSSIPSLTIEQINKYTDEIVQTARHMDELYQKIKLTLTEQSDKPSQI